MKGNSIMRKESEKKGKVTSIRLSQEQHEIIQANAEKRGMTLSSYIVNSAVNSDSALTPADMVEIQNIVNTVYEIALEFLPETAEQIQSEVNKLWLQLK